MKPKYNPQARYVSEDVIEDYLVEHIENLGGMCLKGNPRNQRGFVDRVCIMPGGYTFYVECKKPLKKPRANQKLMINRLNRLGHTAVYVSNKGMVDVLVQHIKKTMATTKAVVGNEHLCYRPNCIHRVGIPWRRHIALQGGKDGQRNP